MLDKVYSTQQVLAVFGLVTALFMAFIYVGGIAISGVWNLVMPGVPMSVEWGGLITCLLWEAGLVVWAGRR